jgi:hypothetical protein
MHQNVVQSSVYDSNTSFESVHAILERCRVCYLCESFVPYGNLSELDAQEQKEGSVESKN